MNYTYRHAHFTTDTPPYAPLPGQAEWARVNATSVVRTFEEGAVPLSHVSQILVTVVNRFTLINICTFFLKGRKIT